MNIGESLKRLRLEKDLTLVEVAQAVGLAVETVRRVEMGKETNDRTAYKIEKFIEGHRVEPVGV